MPAVQIPIKTLSKSAIVFPFEHFQSFARLAFLPIGLTFVASFIGGFLAGLTGVSLLQFLWIPAMTFFQIPFMVGWAKVVAEGDSCILNRSYFAFGQTERHYLIGYILLMVCTTGPAIVTGYWAYLSDWATLPIILTIATFTFGSTVSGALAASSFAPLE